LGNELCVVVVGVAASFVSSFIHDIDKGKGKESERVRERESLKGCLGTSSDGNKI